jgi:hypothetical protein
MEQEHAEQEQMLKLRLEKNRATIERLIASKTTST